MTSQKERRWMCAIGLGLLAIANGAPIYLHIWGVEHPVVGLSVKGVA